MTVNTVIIANASSTVTLKMTLLDNVAIIAQVGCFHSIRSRTSARLFDNRARAIAGANAAASATSTADAATTAITTASHMLFSLDNYKCLETSHRCVQSLSGPYPWIPSELEAGAWESDLYA